METKPQVVKLCGLCREYGCKFYVKYDTETRQRKLFCTETADFIAEMQGFVEAYAINPSTEDQAIHNRWWCNHCEALVYGDQAPGYALKTPFEDGILCKDCIEEIDNLTICRPECVRQEGWLGVDTNHPHWLALFHDWCINPLDQTNNTESFVPSGIYCNPDHIPEPQRIPVSVWHHFRLENTDLEDVRTIFDQVGLDNDLLFRMGCKVLQEAFTDPFEDVFLDVM
ncbi:MAG: hypothetical protein CMP20_02735 [Rickettsiales bacterium]|nr:hypothetical protein [Rickettsiales bacterium]